ncbi:hypothetical protein KO498_03395 [Lentibacter algarum]|uniref:hypothetical protein n=1 Tax=Lentibacter algarum TaxID=576131 RepID=UPI001C07DA1A|nr:hypothetical protein [Lentibacter algarum]MBU2980851.1 hypothetical protein [Lentibacter algarum]
MPTIFRDAFLRALTQTDQPLEQVAVAADVPLARLASLIDGDTITLSVDEAARIAQSLGTSLDQLLGDPALSGHIQIAQLYSGLPPLLKAQLEAYARALADEADHPHSPKPR